MTTWMKYVLGICLPLMFFMVMQDTVAGFYGSRSSELSYVVVEPEEEAPAEEETATEDEAALVEDPAVTTQEAVAEAAADVAPAEEAVEAAEAPATSEDTAVVEEETAEAAPAEEAPAPATDMVAVLSADEMDAGERAARACASCHQFERERNAVGPHLVDVGGRVIGSIEGFRYSDALQALNAEGAVWTAEELEAWLADPSAYAPGTKMNFKVQDAEERRLIAGWLATRGQ